MSRLAGVQAITAQGEGWVLTTSDINRALMELTQFIAQQGNELQDLQIQRPSLEDAFLQLTGHAWSAAA